MSAKRLNPKEGWILRWVGLGGPTSIGEGNKCQQGSWAPKKGVDCDIYPTSVGEEIETFFIRGVEASP